MKRHFLGKKDAYKYVLCVGMCPKMRPVGVTKKRKKKESVTRQIGSLSSVQTTHIDVAPEFFLCGVESGR